MKKNTEAGREFMALAAEKQVREFLRRCEEREEFPESVLLPWEVRMLRAALEADRLGAKTVKVTFRGASGTEAPLRMSTGDIRRAILACAIGDDAGSCRRWPLSAWDTAEGRPVFAAAVETLGGAPRIGDTVKISYGAKTLYGKEAPDDGA